MKTCFLIIAAFISLNVFAQKKPAQKEKAPTQKEMQEMMKEAQRQLDETMNEMSPEDKRMMDSLGIKMPDFNKTAKDVKGVSNKQLANASEKANSIVPKKNVAKIAAIPKAIGAGQMLAYIQSTNQKTYPLLNAKQKSNTDEMLNMLKQKNSSSDYLGNAAMGVWAMGYPEMAFLLMGKVAEADVTNANNLNNYAAMLTMMGAPHLALPILNNINAQFPSNSTILNNIGQAWFQLGDIPKSEKYIDSTIRIYAMHAQANFTKCLIEESKGNIPAAIVAIKKSIKKGHTPEKEAKLKQLGGTPDPKDDYFPQPKKADPLNLGGFQPPPFPTTVMECVTLGMEWNEFRGLINQQLTRLEAENQVATTKAEKFMAVMQHENIALINASKQAGRPLGDITSAPLYAKRAERQLNEATKTYQRKMADLMKKIAAYAQGTGNELRIRYEEKMAKLQKEDLDQTGEGKPNANFCPKYREASDAYLKTNNSEMQLFFKEQIQIEKEYLNESTHWRMYTDYPETYEVAKIGAQMAWLKLLKGEGASKFISITKYVCDPPRSPQKKGLQKFDDVACKYKSELKLPFSKIVSNCSKTYGEFDADFLKFSLTMDAEQGNSIAEQFLDCSVEVGIKKSAKVPVGPTTVEASAGVTASVQIDRNGLKDFTVGAGVETSVELDGTAGSTAAGIEARVSLVSGNTSVGGTGVFEGLR